MSGQIKHKHMVEVTFSSRPASLNRWIWKSERYHPRVEECTATGCEATSKKWANLKQILWVRLPLCHIYRSFSVFTCVFCRFRHTPQWARWASSPGAGAGDSTASMVCDLWGDLKIPKELPNGGIWGVLDSWLTDGSEARRRLGFDSVYLYLAFRKILEPNFGPFLICSLSGAVFIDGLQGRMNVLKLYRYFWTSISMSTLLLG